MTKNKPNSRESSPRMTKQELFGWYKTETLQQISACAQQKGGLRLAKPTLQF